MDDDVVAEHRLDTDDNLVVTEVPDPRVILAHPYANRRRCHGMGRRGGSTALADLGKAQ